MALKQETQIIELPIYKGGNYFHKGGNNIEKEQFIVRRSKNKNSKSKRNSNKIMSNTNKSNMNKSNMNKYKKRMSKKYKSASN